MVLFHSSSYPVYSYVSTALSHLFMFWTNIYKFIKYEYCLSCEVFEKKSTPISCGTSFVLFMCFALSFVELEKESPPFEELLMNLKEGEHLDSKRAVDYQLVLLKMQVCDTVILYKGWSTL